MPKRGWKLDDPLFDTLPRFNKARTQILLNQVYAGDLDSKEELTLQLLAIAKIIITKRLYKNPALQRSIADLLGVVMLQTCIWIDDLNQHRLEINPTPEYYWQIIKNKIHDFNTDDNNPNVSGNWLRKQYNNGKSQPVRVKLQDDLLLINPTVIMDLEDILITLAETDMEREIIVSRFQGFTDDEISGFFGCVRSTITRIRNSLEKRYEDYLDSNKGTDV